jgi:hypothetical protein
VGASRLFQRPLPNRSLDDADSHLQLAALTAEELEVLCPWSALRRAMRVSPLRR